MTAGQKRAVAFGGVALIVVLILGGALWIAATYGFTSESRSNASLVPLPPSADDSLVVGQAKQAGVRTCVDTLARDSSMLSGRYGALSRWATDAADSHLFQSAVALQLPDTQPPTALAFILAAPRGSRCDSATLQIQPVRMSCEAIKAPGGPPLVDFNGILVPSETTGVQRFFVPVAADICVVVASALRFDMNP